MSEHELPQDQPAVSDSPQSCPRSHAVARRTMYGAVLVLGLGNIFLVAAPDSVTGPFTGLLPESWTGGEPTKPDMSFQKCQSCTEVKEAIAARRSCCQSQDQVAKTEHAVSSCCQKSNSAAQESDQLAMVEEASDPLGRYLEDVHFEGEAEHPAPLEPPAPPMPSFE